MLRILVRQGQGGGGGGREKEMARRFSEDAINTNVGGGVMGNGGPGETERKKIGKIKGGEEGRVNGRGRMRGQGLEIIWYKMWKNGVTIDLWAE
eukprot:748375-Hanusia_phi.AAC.5